MKTMPQEYVSLRPFLDMRVPFKDWAKGQEFQVPKDSLQWPSGWEKFKGVFGQRIYEP